MTKAFADLIKDRGWRFRLRVWWLQHVVFPHEQRQWRKACKVIRHWDYYVISDYDHYAAVQAGLWSNDYDIARDRDHEC